MSETIDSIREQLWNQMRDKSYRDTFVAAHLSTNIAAQIQTLRESRGWTKRELAKAAGMSPARISVMEDPSYEKFTLSTLKRLASAFDVAVIARFVPFSNLVDWVANLSPEKLEAAQFDNDKIDQGDAYDLETELPASNESSITNKIIDDFNKPQFGITSALRNEPGLRQNQLRSEFGSTGLLGKAA